MKIILQCGQNFKRKTRAELARPPGFKLSAKKMQEAFLKKPRTEAWGYPSHLRSIGLQNELLHNRGPARPLHSL